MQSIIHRWVDALLKKMGLTASQIDGADKWITLLIIILIAVLIDVVGRYVLVRLVRLIVARTRVTWDDMLFDERVMKRLVKVFTPLVLYALIPFAFPDSSDVLRFLLRVIEVWIVFAAVRLVNAAIAAAFRLMASRPAWQGKPLNGLRQTGQGIAYLIGAILTISILLNRSPAILLTGLGASAAVLMLIFRDSILGFVSGIQLSANNMLKVGDWIAMPKYGADGTVEEVSLITVKIRNWDNTIVTLPPYLLISDSFKNWQAMRRSGGRRVMRSINIDMTSIRFCTAEMLARYRRIRLVRDYIDKAMQEDGKFNSDNGLSTAESFADGRWQTNLGIFRVYLVGYLRSLPTVNHGMTLMVRQLQSTDVGIPVELYFFTDTVEWIAYEGIQSDVFDHVLAVLPMFDLRVYQRPTGYDLYKVGTDVDSAERWIEESARHSIPLEGRAWTDGEPQPVAAADGASQAAEAASESGGAADGSGDGTGRQAPDGAQHRAVLEDAEGVPVGSGAAAPVAGSANRDRAPDDSRPQRKKPGGGRNGG